MGDSCHERLAAAGKEIAELRAELAESRKHHLEVWRWLSGAVGADHDLRYRLAKAETEASLCDWESEYPDKDPPWKWVSGEVERLLIGATAPATPPAASERSGAAAGQPEPKPER